MSRSGPFTRLIDAPARQVERLRLIAQGRDPDPRLEEVSISWQRSTGRYGVDPDSTEAPTILSAGEVRGRREPLDRLILSAQDEIDRLYLMVRDAGYTLLFCDTEGIAVEHRGDEADASRFRYWGTWLGGVWSEAAEGTNGIGTCIVEQRPITVHRDQHFRSRHTDLSCSGAPVFGVDGKLLAVLDVSAIDPDRSERAHALTGTLTVAAARAIEEQFFRECFRKEWIVAIAPPEEGEPALLLALDNHQWIVGANRAARTTLLLDDRSLAEGVGLWSSFERNSALFREHSTADIPTRLILAGSDEAWPALLTPPQRSSAPWQDMTSSALHTRPRSAALAVLRRQAPVQMHRGGLPPGAMRRLHDYVDAHLTESMDLRDLSTVAGLSVFHFARQFKLSMGVTPHYYLVEKRVRRAQEMLATTDLSLSDVAVATGFSDQSHLARHFRQMAGMTPGQFRRSQR
jgi:transcriptional regulator of acetoin/glycerol metabolism/AraC-like DNA-binding protein